MSLVTRLEIANHVEKIFDGSLIRRDDLLSCAGASGARDEVIEVLKRLDPKPYRHLRDLWPELSDIPIDL